MQILGRGPGRSRNLTAEEAEAAMGLILDGRADPHAIGALLMLMRYRGESPEEIAGFTRALRASLPPMPPADLDWPSYAAGRSRGLPWFLLAARLVARSGARVLIHGWAPPQPEGPELREALALAGIGLAADPDEAGRLLDRDGIAFLPLDGFAPQALGLLRLREVLGLRSCINTVCRMLNPAGAAAAVQGVFHPPYMALQQAAGALLGQRRLGILKGGGGEFERNPSKAVTLWRLIGGQPERTELAPLLPEPQRLADGLRSPQALAALWDGRIDDAFARAIVIATAEAALLTLGSPARAEALWEERGRSLAA
ncbi:Anthranilate phosphoribosyltransferase [Rubellimicrobium thermophilum DSM 16684]|uniref:Anthranilate phosphoribosyltransferase n=1 Tax=Rubellimicrobium thermophilum DSM 16684 TaxID=1123069 RepID=S9SC86_9RHOB|nr:glycosyl transferase family protein [Rubellimicrobium thermophilum]EPX87730.1 Anthranilate phosphoribosyltransferase [Rubellimicrobium thermophilum DSM 16684]